MGERAFILLSFLRGSMHQILLFNTPFRRRRVPGISAILRLSVACAAALTLTACGQMGALYQPLPDQEPPAESAIEPASAKNEPTPGRGD